MIESGVTDVTERTVMAGGARGVPAPLWITGRSVTSVTSAIVTETRSAAHLFDNEYINQDFGDLFGGLPLGVAAGRRER